MLWSSITVEEKTLFTAKMPPICKPVTSDAAMPTGALHEDRVIPVASDSTAAAGKTVKTLANALYDVKLDAKSALRSTAVARSSAKRNTLSEQVQLEKDTFVTVARVVAILTALVQLTGGCGEGVRERLDSKSE